MTPPSLRTALLALASAALAGAAGAQNFNLDVSQDFGIPSSSFGAASGQTGSWSFVEASSPGFTIPISDINGASTGASVTYTVVGNGLGNFSFNNSATTGDVQALLDDLLDIGNGGVASETTWDFSGLADGSYDVYTYHFAPDNRTGFSTDVEVMGGAAGVQVCGNAAWTGSFVAGGNFVQDTVTVSGGSLQIRFTSRGLTGNFGSVNGIQLIQSGGCVSPSTYCMAKTSSSGCTPTIGFTGSNSVSAGNFAVTGSMIEGGNQPGVVIWSSSGPGSTPFQGGTLCIAPPVVRLPPQLSGGSLGTCTGAYSQPAAAGVLSSVGAGGTVWFQIWFRDGMDPFGSGLSNGLEVPICP